MTPENTSKLNERFTALYPKFDPRYPLGPSNREFNFECGDGWFDLLWRLSEKLDPLCKANALITLTDSLLTMEESENSWGSGTYAVQVKEKFGTLRFYMSRSTKEMEDLIEAAETESETTCEHCGQVGKTRGDLGWVKTLCEEEYQKIISSPTYRRRQPAPLE